MLSYPCGRPKLLMSRAAKKTRVLRVAFSQPVDDDGHDDEGCQFQDRERPQPPTEQKPATDTASDCTTEAPPSDDDPLEPTWMGDSGFNDRDIHMWKTAEQQMEISNRFPKRKKPGACDQKADDFEAKFPPDKKSEGRFLGSKPGYIYSNGADGVGYYPDDPTKGRGAPVVIAIADLCEAISLLPLAQPSVIEAAEIMHDLSTDPRDRPSTRRARRARNADGTRRKPWTRRMAAIKELPLQTDILVKSIPPFACLTDSAWKKQGLWAILTANPNSWDAAVALLLPYATDDIILLQETRVFRDAFRRTALTTARKKGWNPHLNLALPTLGTIGSAGCGVLAKSGTGLSATGSPAIDDGCAHRIASAWVASVLKGGIQIFSVYLIDSVGINEANKKILDAITATIQTLSGPWIIAGDWNVNPNVLVGSGFLARVGGVLVAPANPSCNDNTYDYFVVCRALSHAVVGAQRVDGVGFTPHRPSRLLIRGDARRFAVRTIVRPKAPCPRT